MLLSWLLGMGLAIAGAGSAKLVSEVSLGAVAPQVRKSLENIGATDIQTLDFTNPGAFDAGLFQSPAQLALLHRAGVSVNFFDRLPKEGPTFVTARLGDARASYTFVNGKLWSMAVTLPFSDIKPTEGPFVADRNRPLYDTIKTLCGSAKSASADEFGNARSWKGSGCSGGNAMVWYDVEDPDAALKAVFYKR